MSKQCRQRWKKMKRERRGRGNATRVLSWSQTCDFAIIRSLKIGHLQSSVIEKYPKSHHGKDSCKFALFLPQTRAFRVSNTNIEIAPCLHSHSFLMWSQCNSDKMIKVSTWRMDKVHLKQTSSLCKVIFTERWNEWSNKLRCRQTAAVYLWRPDNNSTANVTINIMSVKF